MQILNLIPSPEKIYSVVCFFCFLGFFLLFLTNQIFSFNQFPSQPTILSPVLTLYKLRESGSPSGQRRRRKMTWKKIRIRDTRIHRIYIAVPGDHPCMYGPWLQNLRALVSQTSRKTDELGVRVMHTFNVQREGTVSGNRGLDLLISGTYKPKINWKIYSPNSGIWEADTSIKQRDSTRKTGKSTWYLGWENSSPLSGHILNTVFIATKGRRRQPFYNPMCGSMVFCEDDTLMQSSEA